MRTIQLYATGAATASAVANVVIPKKARIKGIQIAATMDAAADNSAVALELSLQAASLIGTNGALEQMLEVRLFQNQGAAGQTQTGINQFFPVNFEVPAGQQIFVHATVTTATYYITAIIHYE